MIYLLAYSLLAYGVLGYLAFAYPDWRMRWWIYVLSPIAAPVLFVLWLMLQDIPQ